MSTITTHILADLKGQLPGAVDPVINAELFNTVVELCLDALQITPPTDPTSSIATWLSDDLWALHQRAITHGVLARMLVVPSRPYTNLTLGEAYVQLWTAALDRARVIAATGSLPTTAFERLMANLRANVPAVRDAQLQQELFNAVDELCRNVLQITPPAHNAAPANWLSDPNWDSFYRILLSGTMVRLLTQPGKSYSDPAIAAYHQGVYNELVTLARGDVEDGPETLVTDRLMENLRVRLPGSKDTVIKLELFNVIDEACRTAGMWIEPIPIALAVGQDLYDITPAGTSVVEVIEVAHPTLDVTDITYDAGQIVLSTVPAADDVDSSPLYVTAQLAPSNTETDITQWLPVDLWTTQHELLLDGTLGRMMSQIAKPYSNPVFATFHGRRFRNAMAMARNGTATGSVAYSRTWSFPRGFV